MDGLGVAERDLGDEMRGEDGSTVWLFSYMSCYFFQPANDDSSEVVIMNSPPLGGWRREVRIVRVLSARWPSRSTIYTGTRTPPSSSVPSAEPNAHGV
jgi:hypothetical protein